MSYQINVRVDQYHSVDPSYIVHYRVTENGSLVGDGIVQYHRLAAGNDIPVHEKIPPAVREELKREINRAVEDFINRRR